MNGSQFSFSQALNPWVDSLVWTRLLVFASIETGDCDPMGFARSGGTQSGLLYVVLGDVWGLKDDSDFMSANVKSELLPVL